MIRNQWYGILDSKEVKNKKPIGVTRLGEKLVFWRSEDGRVNCIFDKCCHRGASLSAGKVVHDKITCPFHGFQYDASGKVTLIP
ncbi:Rieske 2Fe-2S domain-containing protein, partial [Clostridium sp.]